MLLDFARELEIFSNACCQIAKVFIQKIFIFYNCIFTVGSTFEVETECETVVCNKQIRFENTYFLEH